MASISIIGMTGWVNPYSRLPGALGPSSSHGGGLRAPFFCGKPRGFDLWGLRSVGGVLKVERRRA
jgi:hypothetical protein